MAAVDPSAGADTGGTRRSVVPTLAKVLLILGAIGGASRFVFGLGATTNLNDGYPWGLWISFDVLTGVALAAGGFTVSAAVYVFNLKKFQPLLRPAKVSAFVGYVMVVIGLLFDLGLPWRVWHPLMMWNPQSVLFEVAWCVMLYTSVLAIDVVIMLLEVLKKERWVALLRSVYVFLIVAGIVLSTLHQSSLGALYLVVPQKLSELWASPALGLLFYASAAIAGLSVVILESLLGAKVQRREPELELLSSLSKGLGAALLVYLGMKVTDLYARDIEVWRLDAMHVLFQFELCVTVAVPAVLLTFFPEVRRRRAGLLWCAGLAAFGVALNRFNVSLIGYAGYEDFRYFPSVVELVVSVALIALGIVSFNLAARNLPVYERALDRAPAQSRS